MTVEEATQALVDAQSNMLTLLAILGAKQKHWRNQYEEGYKIHKQICENVLVWLDTNETEACLNKEFQKELEKINILRRHIKTLIQIWTYIECTYEN